MITCKEDLINTAVFCKRGELRDLYIKKCEQLGIDWEHNLDINNYSFLYVKEDMRLHGVQTVTDSYYLHLKRLTLSDLKPRTKTVFEKVDLPTNEIAKSMIDGQVFYNRYGSDKFSWKLNEFRKNGLALIGLNGFDFYRKVEKEIDWREEVHNKFKSSGYHWSTPIAEVINDESDCFLGLCRVALLATGGLV